MLARLLDGLDAIGSDRDQALGIDIKTGLDSVPALGFAVLTTLHSDDGRLNTNELATAVRHPAQTTRRALEDLTAHGLVDCHRGEAERAPHHWELTQFARSRFDAFPDFIYYWF